MLRLAAHHSAAPFERAFRRGTAAFALLGLLCVACSGEPGPSSGLGPLPTGALRVTVAGLPAGVAAAIEVSSSQGYQQQLTASETLSGLATGAYAIAALDVLVAGDRYMPAPASQNVIVGSGAETVVVVSYVLVTGRLTLGIGGVPAGASASVRVTGPGFDQVHSQDTTLIGLTPGSYTIAAANLNAEGQLYLPNPASQGVAVAAGLQAAQALVGYSLAPATLTLTVSGLPNGTAALVTITGPGGYSASLSGSQTLTGLLAGSYGISSGPVTALGFTYSGTPAEQSVELAGGGTGAAAVSYAASSGNLLVSVTGLPSGASATVTVNGPAGYSHQLTGSALLNGLAPGAYTVSAAMVAQGGFSYLPAPASQPVTVSPATTTTAAVSYGVTTGALQLAVTGLPEGTSAAIGISGPGGFTQQAGGSATLSDLAPGDYTVSATAVSSGGSSYAPTPATQVVAVGVGATATAGVSYAGVPGGVDLRIDAVYLTQATQRYDGSVPLVAGRSAYLRVFALANQANTTQAQVRVRLYAGAALVETYTINPGASGVPTTADEGPLHLSWNVLVPAARVQPGLRVLADVDPANSVLEPNEANNLFPASGVAAAVNVQSLPPFSLRFVPVLQQANGLQGNVTAANHETFLGDVKKLLPVGAYDADLRQPYTTTAPALQSSNANGAWNTVLSELLALRSADASARYYYGVVKVGYGSGVAGMGYLGGSARTSMGWDYLPSGVGVMAHEVGHNMGRSHAPCGGPANPDAGYPYPNGQIGVWGLDLVTLNAKPPTLADLMSYCGPSWVSDYSWSGMVSYRLGGPNNTPGAGAGSGLLVWGRVSPAGIVLEPAFRVPAAPGLGPRGGSELLELLGSDGSVLRAVRFDASAIADDPNGERHFALVVPLDPALEASLAGLRVVAGSRSALRTTRPAGDPALTLARVAPREVELRWDVARFPVVMVRDAATGQVLSFARGGSARFAAAGQDFLLQFSDGVRNVNRQARVLR